MSKTNDNCQHRHTLSHDLTLHGSEMHRSVMLHAKETH